MKNCFDRTPHTMKDWLLLAAGVAAVFAAADWLPGVLRGAGAFLGLLAPFGWGLLLAYVLDIPTRFFAQKLFGGRRGGAMAVSYALFFGALALLAAVYGAVYGLMFWLERSRPLPEKHLDISNKAALAAFVMAGTVFVVSNLLFLGESPATMNVFCIRTLVDFCGVLILTLQHEQLRESALHQELSAMDNVLHRQYEQYKRSKEGIELINSRYHELKVQIADIRAQRDRAKQDAALAKMENSILQYEAENKTGNPVLDILLTAKSMECQEKQIRMTSVADGHLLDHLSTREICTLVGTALDNAIESCAAEQDPEKRLIRTAVYAQNGFVLFRVENYCKKPVELGADGLPLRSAHGGYDLRSLQAAAQQHSGSMTVHWEDGWFTLRVLLPQAGIQQTEGGE